MADNSSKGCGGWVSTFIFSILILMIIAIVRSCFFTKHNDPVDVGYTVGEIYHIGKYRSQPTYIYLVYKARNTIYSKEITTDHFGEEWKKGSPTIKVLVAYSISSPDLSDLLEEVVLPDTCRIGMNMNEKFVQATLSHSPKDKVSFDTWNKARVDSFRIREYFKVLDERIK